MPNLIDLTGMRFGKLTVLCRNGRTRNKAVLWRCECDCGGEKDVAGGKLKSGWTKSCGCYQVEKIQSELEDYSGKRFGRLTVVKLSKTVKHHGRKWECLCDCGNTTFVYTDSLNRGVESCGCKQKDDNYTLNFRDMTGLTFGRLTVLECAGRNKFNQFLWKCKCSCGNEHTTTRGALVSGGVTSCGCYNLEVVTKHGLSRTKEYILMYGRKSARKRRRLADELDQFWTIDMEMEISKFFPKCVVCGGEFKMAVDHVLPLSKGHGLIPGNAVRLCTRCNTRKLNSTPDKMNKKFLKEEWDKVLSAASQFKNHWEEISLDKEWA